MSSPALRTSPRKSPAASTVAPTGTGAASSASVEVESPTSDTIKQMTTNARFRLMHVIVHHETVAFVQKAGQSASMQQLDVGWSNGKALLSYLHTKFHDAEFNPELETNLIANYLNADAHPDPQWPTRGYDIPQATLVKYYKRTRTVRSNACRELPSGNNDPDWEEIYQLCFESIGNPVKLLEVYYLIRLMKAHGLLELAKHFVSVIEPAIQVESQNFDDVGTNPRRALILTDASASGSASGSGSAMRRTSKSKGGGEGDVRGKKKKVVIENTVSKKVEKRKAATTAATLESAKMLRRSITHSEKAKAKTEKREKTEARSHLV